MRIAVVHGVGFFYSGGGEKLVIQEVLGLRERGHQVECFAPVVDPRRCFPGWLERVGAQRVVPRLPGALPYGDAVAVIAASYDARRVARRFRGFDVVLAANQPGPHLAWWAAQEHGVPYVIYLAQPLRLLHPRAIDRGNGVSAKRDYDLLHRLAPLGRRTIEVADERSVAGARLALANGTYMRGVLERVYARPFVSCPAGAALVEGDADRARGDIVVNGARIRKPFVLLTNRHFPQKRFEYAIEALDHPELARRGTELVISGQATAYTARLRRLVASRGLAERVRFVGLASEADLARLYAAAACYVYPSPEEDFGMGVVEAMAAATPVVAWDHAGPTGTMVQGQTGYLVPAGDVAAFAERVAEIVTDEPLARRLGRAAQTHVRSNFTLQRHLDGIETALGAAATAGRSVGARIA